MICDDGGSTEFLVDVWITIFGLPLFLTLSRELTPEWRSKFHQRTEPSRRGLGTTSYGEKAPQLALKPIGKVDNHHRASNRNLRVPSTRTVRRSSIANYRDQQRRARQAGNHSFSWLCQQTSPLQTTAAEAGAEERATLQAPMIARSARGAEDFHWAVSIFWSPLRKP
jgi:hypothetical protein